MRQSYIIWGDEHKIWLEWHALRACRVWHGLALNTDVHCIFYLPLSRHYFFCPEDIVWFFSVLKILSDFFLSWRYCLIFFCPEDIVWFFSVLKILSDFFLSWRYCLIFSVLKILSDFFSVLKILSDFLIMEANTMYPDPREQSDMGPYHLQWRCLITLSRREEQTTSHDLREKG